MKYFLLILIFFFSNLSKAADLVLTIGESKRLPHAGSVWVENGKTIHIEDSGRDFILKALRPGASEFRLGENRYSVSVLSLRQANTLQLLKPIVHQSLNQKILVSSGEVQVTGRIQSWKDWSLLAKACQKRNCHYSFQSKMDPEVFQESERQILKAISNFSLPKLHIEIGDGYFVKVPEKAPYLKALENALSPYGVEVIADQNSIDVAPLIKVQITVAEIKRDFMTKYGLKWPSAYKAQILPNTALPALSDEELKEGSLSAHALEASGAGRILATPNILCRSGKEAEFLAGGEFPIKILNMKIQEVVWKRYGVLMKVKPLADFNGRMSISIETEISSIDPARAVDGIPALFTNRVQSHFDLLKPKTIALSGLIKNEESRNSEGLPWISRIPILGALFSSKEYRDNKTELVIFVRPEILDADAPDTDMNLPGSIQ